MTIRRSDRVADRIRRLLAPLIQDELRDPRVGFVTLTDIRLSPDLRHAQVFVTVLGSEEPEGALDALNRSVPFLRKSLAREGGLRFTPQLKFLLDDVDASGQRLDQILQKIRVEHPDPPDDA